MTHSFMALQWSVHSGYLEHAPGASPSTTTPAANIGVHLDLAFDCASMVIGKLEAPYVADAGVGHPMPRYVNLVMQAGISSALAMSSEMRPWRDVFEYHATIPILPGFVGAFKLGALHTRIADLLDAVGVLLSYIITCEGGLDSNVLQLHAWTETLALFRSEMAMLKYNHDMLDMLERLSIAG